MAQAVQQALKTIRQYNLPPDKIDEAILAAVNVMLGKASGFSDLVAEGFNGDVERNGRSFPSKPQQNKMLKNSFQ